MVPRTVVLCVHPARGFPTDTSARAAGFPASVKRPEFPRDFIERV